MMYEERMTKSEETPLKVYYTDRQDVPVAIDISGKEGKEKLTDNSNFFCLGPSGSGKSFHMNSVVRQLWEQNTDVVMVDTGNSYEGLCEYVGGKYISYTEENPITMNPFRIQREELNVEKIGFLKNLIMLIWKGSNGEVSKTEDRLSSRSLLNTMKLILLVSKAILPLRGMLYIKSSSLKQPHKAVLQTPIRKSRRGLISVSRRWKTAGKR